MAKKIEELYRCPIIFFLMFYRWIILLDKNLGFKKFIQTYSRWAIYFLSMNHRRKKKNRIKRWAKKKSRGMPCVCASYDGWWYRLELASITARRWLLAPQVMLPVFWWTKTGTSAATSDGHTGPPWPVVLGCLVQHFWPYIVGFFGAFFHQNMILVWCYKNVYVMITIRTIWKNVKTHKKYWT
jgi:hypothetical protein